MPSAVRQGPHPFFGSPGSWIGSTILALSIETALFRIFELAGRCGSPRQIVALELPLRSQP